ncbi:hypothetical protein DFJ77DRAFT_552366, partial [Powellomyces hirtus]
KRGNGASAPPTNREAKQLRRLFVGEKIVIDIVPSPFQEFTYGWVYRAPSSSKADLRKIYLNEELFLGALAPNATETLDAFIERQTKTLFVLLGVAEHEAGHYVVSNDTTGHGGSPGDEAGNFAEGKLYGGIIQYAYPTNGNRNQVTEVTLFLNNANVVIPTNQIIRRLAAAAPAPFTAAELAGLAPPGPGFAFRKTVDLEEGTVGGPTGTGAAPTAAQAVAGSPGAGLHQSTAAYTGKQLGYHRRDYDSQGKRI